MGKWKEKRQAKRQNALARAEITAAGWKKPVHGLTIGAAAPEKKEKDKTPVSRGNRPELASGYRADLYYNETGSASYHTESNQQLQREITEAVLRLLAQPAAEREASSSSSSSSTTSTADPIASSSDNATTEASSSTPSATEVIPTEEAATTRASASCVTELLTEKGGAGLLLDLGSGSGFSIGTVLRHIASMQRRTTQFHSAWIIGGDVSQDMLLQSREFLKATGPATTTPATSSSTSSASTSEASSSSQSKKKKKKKKKNRCSPEVIFSTKAMSAQREGRVHKFDLIRMDFGQPLPFRKDVFDGAVSVSALQWLTKDEQRRNLFEGLRTSLLEGGRAGFQFYPETSEAFEETARSARRHGQLLTAGVMDMMHANTKQKWVLFAEKLPPDSPPLSLPLGHCLLSSPFPAPCAFALKQAMAQRSGKGVTRADHDGEIEQRLAAAHHMCQQEREQLRAVAHASPTTISTIIRESALSGGASGPAPSLHYEAGSPLARLANHDSL